MPYTPDDFDACLRVLQEISEDPTTMDEHDRFKGLVAKINREARKIHARAARNDAIASDRQERHRTQRVRSELQAPGPLAPSQEPDSAPAGLVRPERCYICKLPYTDLHFFYHLLCPTCAFANYQHRNQRADLRGRTALITGGRIKIGYHVALRMLRDGARVAVTTRFPRDAASRFQAEPDWEEWQRRLEIHELDLRFVPAVEEFSRWFLDSHSALDVLVNNAAQTIKRPAAFYEHLLHEAERPTEIVGRTEARTVNATSDALVATCDLAHSERDTVGETDRFFPPGLLDRDGQQVDLRPMNSWQQRLGDVSVVEMLEVQLVNAVAPFILASQLKPLMLRSPFPRRFIVNVSAMEGQFNRERKTIYHPHTNMAKAALNMLTRTSASDYARDGIFMNSVDTGWITDENAYPKRTRMREQGGFFTPLDVIEGMARIYHPVVHGLNEANEPFSGCFLKDYMPHPW